jgi:hypothetical protein
LATSTLSNTVRALLGDGGGGGGARPGRTNGTFVRTDGTSVPFVARGGCGHGAHIRKTPKAGSARGAFAAADRDRPSTVRVSSGSITPSSHSRAVE